MILIEDLWFYIIHRNSLDLFFFVVQSVKFTPVTFVIQFTVLKQLYNEVKLVQNVAHKGSV